MPDTAVMLFWRNKAAVSPHTPEVSRSGSSASCTRRMPVLSSLAASSAGVVGCNDQLHTANRSVRELFFMLMLSHPSPIPDDSLLITGYRSLPQNWSSFSLNNRLNVVSDP